MCRIKYAWVVSIAMLVGCVIPASQDLLSDSALDSVASVTITTSDTPPPGSGSSGGDTSGLDLPSTSLEAVRISVSNPTARDADVHVTMELLGVEVHASLRRIAAGAESVIVGPDSAETIRINATFLGEPIVSMKQRVLRLGVDFEAGDLIEFALEIPQDETPGNDQTDDQGGQDQPDAPPPDDRPTGNGNNPGGGGGGTPALTLSIDGLNENVLVRRGTLVGFDVLTGNTTDGAVFSAFAEQDGIPNTGDEIAIVVDQDAVPLTAVFWDTSEAALDVPYYIYVELTSGSSTIFAYAPGQVTLNQAFVSLERLDTDIIVRPGSVVEFDVVASNTDDDSRIFVTAEPDDGDPNSIIVLADEPAAALTTVSWDTSGVGRREGYGVPPGRYTIAVELFNANNELEAMDQGDGQIVLNVKPAGEYGVYAESSILTIGEDYFTVVGEAYDPDDDAQITMFLDTNRKLDGNELEFLTRSEDAGVFEVSIFTGDIAGIRPQRFFVGMVVRDSVTGDPLVYWGPQLRFRGTLDPSGNYLEPPD